MRNEFNNRISENIPGKYLLQCLTLKTAYCPSVLEHSFEMLTESLHLCLLHRSTWRVQQTDDLCTVKKIKEISKKGSFLEEAEARVLRAWLERSTLGQGRIKSLENWAAACSSIWQRRMEIGTKPWILMVQYLMECGEGWEGKKCEAQGRISSHLLRISYWLFFLVYTSS